MDRIAMLMVGLIYIGGGSFFIIKSFEARMMFTVMFFGAFGILIGLFLLYTAFVGPSLN